MLIGTGFLSAFWYSGCAGSPDLFNFKQCRFGRNPRTCSERPRNEPSFPHAATTKPASLDSFISHSLFSEPTGSAAAFISFGAVARNAKMLAMHTPPKPQD